MKHILVVMLTLVFGGSLAIGCNKGESKEESKPAATKEAPAAKTPPAPAAKTPAAPAAGATKEPAANAPDKADEAAKDDGAGDDDDPIIDEADED